jgi:hypothetical protein
LNSIVIEMNKAVVHWMICTLGIKIQTWFFRWEIKNMIQIPKEKIG